MNFLPKDQVPGTGIMRYVVFKIIHPVIFFTCDQFPFWCPNLVACHHATISPLCLLFSRIDCVGYAGWCLLTKLARGECHGFPWPHGPWSVSLRVNHLHGEFQSNDRPEPFRTVIVSILRGRPFPGNCCYGTGSVRRSRQVP